MKKILVVLVFSLFIISCSDKASKNQLIGEYRWSNSQKGGLIVKSDMTYTYNFDLNPNDTAQNIGTWEFDSLLQEIHFNNFRFTETEGLKGVWISRIRIKNDETHLMYASDSDIYLKKIE